MVNLKGLELPEIEALVKAEKESSYRARQIFSWIYEKQVSSFEDMTNLSKESRKRFSEIWEIKKLEIARVQQSEDRDTAKYLFQLPDGDTVETVLMYFDNRLSVCLSTQVGCAYGCEFCASGVMGWKRHLEAWEIVDQFLQIQRKQTERISNIVFMGMGEPLANYDNTLKALRLLHDPSGPGIGMRHMTISTVGLAPMIKRLADEGHPIRLAVSLHAPNDELREKLMPVNKKYKIADLMEACHYYQSKVKRRMTFEYTLIDQVNDSPSLAHEMVNLLRGLHCHVNLIPLNPMESYPHKAPPPGRVQAFQKILEDGGFPASVRQERGQDIQAACGQLRLRELKGFSPCA